ncbi:carboxypeptidase-like regulatory domain-containing protein [Hymenobacter cellulosivorans]|uniref:Carboxypeptidase-like regulatory domain-containing protein n=1 Tax=Hymenobacter cellulosivorans TaxID=2932249 RepID=A0ABY4FCV1_9BACT|nr:carboxypeptidase-like regulatory domain-containing protein [Hymenobacter cellulosivorans]UOQ54313.1 carboxypeptidase-like regulatory domain-containing protein [Hymenobacter cellulosivorans]
MLHVSALVGFALLFAGPSALAQTLVSTDADKDFGAEASTRLNCQPLAGQVTDVNGLPVIGATLFLKGTSNAYITDEKGNFEITAPVSQKQIVAVEAAGYLPSLITLTTCKLPDIVLERDPTVRIKRSGKKAGQIVRYGDAYRQ